MSSGSICVGASSVAEVRLEEGKGEESSYCRDMLRERFKAFAVEKPKKYYAVARGRVPGIYMSWAETKPLVSRFRRSKYESFETREEAENWLIRNKQTQCSVKY